MSKNAAQGSVRITRLRNGDNILSTLFSDKPLFQGVLDSGAVSPDWSTPSEQPKISPEIYSSYGNTVKVESFSWYYNGSTTPLVFGDIDTATGWRTENHTPPRFMVYDSDAGAEKKGTLKIIANLASKSNTGNDLLEFRANVESAGVNQNVVSVIDILIQPMGASSYRGLITASATTFTEQVQTITLTPSLVSASGITGNYSVKWFKDSEEVTANVNSSTKALTVGRDDVNGAQIYIAQFLVDGVVVSSYGITLTDTTDEFHVVFDMKNTNGGTGNSINSSTDQITVTAKLVGRDNTPITPTDIKWSIDIRDHATWESVLPNGAESGNTITVTSAHTDRNGQQNDVEVIAEAEW